MNTIYLHMSDETLVKEYLALQKASLNKMFGRNAREASNKIADILNQRGIYEIANIFGPIAVRKWDENFWA